MPTQNDVTGDMIQSKINSNTYRGNWDRIFAKSEEEQKAEDDSLYDSIVDATLGSDDYKKVTVKACYSEEASNALKEIIGVSFDELEYSDDLLIYEIISMMENMTYPCFGEEDMDTMIMMKHVAYHCMIDDQIERFDQFYNKLIEERLINE